jgi:hypothetical protein
MKIKSILEAALDTKGNEYMLYMELYCTEASKPKQHSDGESHLYYIRVFINHKNELIINYTDIDDVYLLSQDNRQGQNKHNNEENKGQNSEKEQNKGNELVSPDILMSSYEIKLMTGDIQKIEQEELFMVTIPLIEEKDFTVNLRPALYGPDEYIIKFNSEYIKQLTYEIESLRQE